MFGKKLIAALLTGAVLLGSTAGASVSASPAKNNGMRDMTTMSTACVT